MAKTRHYKRTKKSGSLSTRHLETFSHHLNSIKHLNFIARTSRQDQTHDECSSTHAEVKYTNQLTEKFTDLRRYHPVGEEQNQEIVHTHPNGYKWIVLRGTKSSLGRERLVIPVLRVRDHHHHCGNRKPPVFSKPIRPEPRRLLKCERYACILKSTQEEEKNA